jgi:hypothetical protein
MKVELDKSRTDRRLVYFRPEGALDMTGNHNEAVAAADGDYVCLIGDDDTISQEALTAAEWAKNSGFDVIAPNIVANYAWPDFRSIHMGSRHQSRLYISRTIGGASIQSSATALHSALGSATQGTEGLPKVYHGIVSRPLLERIRNRSGAYFHGSSPDVSGAIGLALCGERFVVVNYPLTIPGASGGSNTGRSAMNKHKGRLDQESQTKAFESGGWSAGVPRFFSVETVWAHAALETIQRIAPQQVTAFNFARLLAICRVLHPEFQSEIDRAVIEAQALLGMTKDALHKALSTETRDFRWTRFTRVARRLARPSAAGGRLYVSGLESIAETPEALARYMAEHGLCWGDTVSALGQPPSRQGR